MSGPDALADVASAPPRNQPEAAARAASNAPRVVAIVLDWNGTEDTLRCLRSLRRVTTPGLEVVVVDNGSRPGLEAALRADGFAGVVLRSESNLGYAGGNNLGLGHALARGADFAWVLNNDAEVDPGALDALLAAAGREPRAGAFGSRVLRGDDPSRVWVAWGRVTWRQSLIALDGEDEPDGARFAGERDVEWLPGCALLLRREALEQVGGFDEEFFAYHEDVDWAARARALGWTCRYVGASRVRHHVHGSSGGASHYGGFRKYLSARNTVLYARRHGSAANKAMLVACILATFPLQLLRRALTGQAAGVWIKWRGWRDALAGRPIPFVELGLRPANPG